MNLRPAVLKSLFPRRFFIRASVFFNFCVLTYVAFHAVQNGSLSTSNIQQLVIVPEVVSSNPDEQELPTITSSTTEEEPGSTTFDTATTSSSLNYLSISCRNKDPTFSYSQRGIFWILSNYVLADRYYNCDESVTYTTHGDVTFLDNVLPLVRRWQGPISLAVYTPGSDYQLALTSVAYLRQCGDPAIRERVTFHMILDMRHFPQQIYRLHTNQGMNSVKGSLDQLPEADCSLPAPWEALPQDFVTFKRSKNLTYPVNVLRNVARNNAQTHYVLASDAELYPSPNLVTEFFRMLQRNDSVLNLGRPKVFVLPIFEVYANQTVPATKVELVSKLKTGMAIPFHKKVCSYCHSIPKINEWVRDKNTEGLRVFHVAKRHKPHDRWEPIYIGTQDDPLYDERLTWEGKSDKMTQGYALCALDYDFMILDNAFLVHRPGVKFYKKDSVRDAYARKQSALIRYTILKELKLMYGSRPECVL